MSSTQTLSPKIAAKLAEVRRLLRKYVLWHSAALATLWCLAIFWLGGLIDYLPVRVGASETPKGVRIAMLVVIAAGLVWILFRYLLPPLVRHIPNRSLALLFERKFPSLKNSLVTTVELVDRAADDTSSATAYRDMLSVAHTQADQTLGSIPAENVFNWRPLRWVIAAAALGLIATACFAAVQTSWMQTWTWRLFGLSDARWPRESELRVDGVQLQVPSFTGELGSNRILVPFTQNVARVPAGAEVLLQISASTETARTPEVCTIFYRSSTGSRGRANMRRVGNPLEGWQAFNIDGPPLDGLTDDMAFDVVGHDARVRDLQLQVVAPATVAKMSLQCTYPEYLLASRQSSSAQRGATELLDYRSGQRIPEGTNISLRGTASCNLSRVEYVLLTPVDPAPTADDAASETVVHQVATTGTEFEIPLGTLFANQVIEVRLVDEFGLPAEQIPRYVLTISPDTVPDVASQLAGIGSSVTPNAVLPIRGTIEDDYGIASISAEVALDDTNRITTPLTTDDDGALDSNLDLLALQDAGTLTPTPGQALRINVSATDYYDLGIDPHIGLGQPQQLTIVTVDELLVILDRQEIEQRQRLELIIAELGQLRDLLDAVGTQFAQLPVESAGNAEDDQEAEKSAIRRRGIKAQQSVLQADKSHQELLSLRARIDNLRLQLINNRIDSYDRQQRLQLKVLDPLTSLLDGPFASFQTELQALQVAVAAAKGQAELLQTRDRIDDILIQLSEIQNNMMNMQSFNELIDLVRGLLDEQDTLLDETQAEQRRRIMDLLNQ